MKPRFQADADLNYKIVIGLRRREPSVDILSTVDGGVIGVPDLDVLAVAAESNRVLISHDRRTMPRFFSEFLKSRQNPGLIIVSQDFDISAAIDDLILLWAVCDAKEFVGQITFLPV